MHSHVQKAAEVEAKLKANADEYVSALKAESEENLKAQTEQTSKIKAELGLKMLRMKVDANDMIAKEQIKTKELEMQIVKLENEICGNTTKNQSNPKTGNSISNTKTFAEKLSGYTKTMEVLENSPMTSNTP